MNLLALSFHDALWLLPVAAGIHVLEELPRFPAWANRTLTSRRGVMCYTRAKFIWENLVLFVILVAAVLATRYLPAASLGGQAGLVLSLGAAAGLFFNMLFHAGFTLRTGVYSPGTVTACLLFFPVSALVFGKAALAGVLGPGVIALAVVLGIVLLPIVVGVVHRAIDRGVTARSVLKLVAKGIVPLIVVSLLGLIVGEALTRKIMMVAGPLAMLPLVLKWLRARRRAVNAGGNQ